jgi:uncharacterized RDD family membrane protein YckC
MAYPVPQADPTSVFGRRVLAAIIDWTLIVIPVVIAITSQFEYHEVDGLGVSAEQFCDTYMDERGGICVNADGVDGRVYFSDAGQGAGNGLLFGLSFGVLVVLQGFTGWTPGKLLTGIRTVQEDGSRPGFVKALLRWLLWIADGFPYFLPLVGFIVGLTTTGHRRIGDMVAKTFVVRRDAAGSPIVVHGLTPSVPPGAAPWGTPPPGSGWSPPPADPATPGWASPTPPPPPAASRPVPVAAEGPQWDDARGTYIQWDPAAGAWMQWDEGSKAWSRIPGQ